MATEIGILMASIFLPLLLSPLAYFLGKKRGTGVVTWFSFSILVITYNFIDYPYPYSLKRKSCI